MPEEEEESRRSRSTAEPVLSQGPRRGMHLDRGRWGVPTSIFTCKFGEYCIQDCCLPSCSEKGVYKLRFSKMVGSASKETGMIKAENFQESRLQDKSM